MVNAWYFDNDQNPTKYITSEELREKTGVVITKLNLKTMESELEEIRKEREYGYLDIIDINPDTLENYQEKVKGFQTEHLHPDEEIRMVLTGTTYFDVRNVSDEWIRFQLLPGDLVVLPPGIFHRLSINDMKPRAILYRLFKKSPVWTSTNRHEIETH